MFTAASALRLRRAIITMKDVIIDDYVYADDATARGYVLRESCRHDTMTFDDAFTFVTRGC